LYTFLEFLYSITIASIDKTFFLDVLYYTEVTILCSKCCEEIPDESIICPECGNTVSSASFTTSDWTERKRHWFTSFYLIFSLLSALSAGFLYGFEPEIFSAVDISGLVRLHIITAILQVVGSILLLCWKKAGFWVYAGSYLVGTIISIAMGIHPAFLIITGVIAIAIMWNVLHIHKNGKSTWQHLQR